MPTRWVLRGKLLLATLDEYDVLIQVMESLADTADVKTAATARGLELGLIQLETFLSIHLLLPIFRLVEMLSKALQCKQATVFGSIEAANNIIDELNDMKNSSFDDIYRNYLIKGETLNLNPPKD